MTAKRSKLFDVKVEKAGLLDFRIQSIGFQTNFKPAIQADFSHHVFEHLEVSNNDYDGLGVMYSDIYYPDKVNYIKDSKFVANKRHGISFRQLGMNIANTEIRENVRSGIHHDPKLEKLEQRELMEWMSLIDEQTPNTIIRFVFYAFFFFTFFKQFFGSYYLFTIMEFVDIFCLLFSDCLNPKKDVIQKIP